MTRRLRPNSASPAPTAACLPRAQSRGGFATDPRLDLEVPSFPRFPQNFPQFRKLRHDVTPPRPPSCLLPLASCLPSACNTLHQNATLSALAQNATFPARDGMQRFATLSAPALRATPASQPYGTKPRQPTVPPISATP